jgi:predicted transporter
MDDKPRYRIRANTTALSRTEWWILGVAIFVGIFGLGLVLGSNFTSVWGSRLMILSTLTISITVLITLARHPGR